MAGRRRTGFWFIVVFVTLASCRAVVYADHLRDPERVAKLLELGAPVVSLRNVECRSVAITDVIINCAFDLDPADFPLLLEGLSFRSQGGGGLSGGSNWDSNIKPIFEVAERYRYEKNRGNVVVTIKANAKRTRAQIGYFEE